MWRTTCCRIWMAWSISRPCRHCISATTLWATPGPHSSCRWELGRGFHQMFYLALIPPPPPPKALKQLEILSLVGNPLCQREDYRLFVLFHVDQIKVLDGVGVTESELDAASRRFEGKLSLDLMAHVAGAHRLSELKEFDLAGVALRDIALDNIAGLPSSSVLLDRLTVLRLDHNNLQHFGGLACLLNLRELSLNNNKIRRYMLGRWVGQGRMGVPFGIEGWTEN